MNLGVAADDERRIEVLASGLPCFNGAQLAVDITLRSAVSADGEPRSQAARVDGATLDAARLDKEDKYAELVGGRRCQLVVVAVETGGRWSDEAVAFLQALASARARAAPPYLRRATQFAWLRRWSRVLATACSVAFAASLVEPCSDNAAAPLDGPAPSLEALFGQAGRDAPQPSRLPLRG